MFLSVLKIHTQNKSRQSLLTLKKDKNLVEATSKDPIGVVGTWKFDQEGIRKALTHMLIIDEIPFKFMERDGFNKFMAATCPMFKIPSRATITRDCLNLFIDEKLKLKNFIKTNTQRISITIDTWTSIQKINCMCVTTHFIDSEWRLQKKIISFVSITSHRGEYIAKTLENALLE